MRTRIGAGRSWGLFALATVASLIAAPTWAACNGNPNARIDPGTQTVSERTNGAPTVVTLDGSSSTPKNGDMLFAWQQIGTPLVTLNNANTSKPTFTAPDVGPTGAALRFRLTVTCGTSTNSLETVVNVTDLFINSPPSASAFISPVNPTEGQTVTLDGSLSSDPDGQTLTYTWQQISGTPIVTLANASANGSIQTFVAPNVPDTRTLGFRLTVSDGALSAIADRTVNITWTNDPPVAALACPAGGVRVVDEGQSVTFDASGSFDPDGSIASYAWSQNVGLPNLQIGALTTPSITFNAPHLGFNQLGGMTVTATVFDNNAVSASAACGLFINDVTAPVIVVPDDMEEEATSAAGAQVFYAVTKQDAVEDELPVPLACSPSSGNVFALDATTTVQCNAIDAAGNASNASFKISVVDTTPPTLDAPGDTMIEATGPEGATGTYSATTFDLVDGNGVATCTPPSGSVFPIGDTLVTCSAVDAHHNAAEDKTFTFSVIDTTPPVVTVPADFTQEATSAAGAVVNFSSSAHDLVSGDLPTTCSAASGSTFALGTTTVTCTAKDAAGNIGSASFKVSVVDTTPPDLTVPANIIEEATSPSGATVMFAPSATDLVDANVDIQCSPNSGATFGLGITTVSCSATDDFGNTSGGSFTVTVRDTTPPTLHLPADFNVEATSAAGAIATYSASADDIVDTSVAAVCTPASGSTFALGYTEVDCSATDDAGNTATASFGIRVVDTTAPVIAWHADIDAIATANSKALVNYTNPAASDLVDGNVATTCVAASGTWFNTGANTINCTATDKAGNSSTSSFKVNVRFAFNGFFRPIDNLPTVNAVNAGQAIPVKFSLGGDQGLAIFATGWPKVAVMGCQANATQDLVEETVTAGNSSLSYSTSGEYNYVWKTDKSWAGTCRQLQVKFSDGTMQVANFVFKK